MLMIGLSLMMSRTPTAPVGLGSAAWMPPKLAQLPIGMIATAPSAALFSDSRAVFPDTLQ